MCGISVRNLVIVCGVIRVLCLLLISSNGYFIWCVVLVSVFWCCLLLCVSLVIRCGF